MKNEKLNDWTIRTMDNGQWKMDNGQWKMDNLVKVVKVKMVKIENSQECFVQLWRLLERTRRLLGGQYKRFCIRNVLKAWFGAEANDDNIWEVCNLCEQEGWNELPPPSLNPRKHRELLRAIVAVKTGIRFGKINLKALDAAYSIAFPKSTPINVNKKGTV